MLKASLLEYLNPHRLLVTLTALKGGDKMYREYSIHKKKSKKFRLKKFKLFVDTIKTLLDIFKFFG